LVAKEYVAAQDPDDPGVLLLSQFAGAAFELGSALIVNPHDPEGVAAALRRALDMPVEERRARHARMMDSLRSSTPRDWARDFVAALDAVPRGSDTSARQVKPAPVLRPLSRLS
jgi:trehalose 6-phosphate synthase